MEGGIFGGIDTKLLRSPTLAGACVRVSPLSLLALAAVGPDGVDTPASNA